MVERNSVTEGAAPKLSNPWVVLIALLTVYIFNYADRFLITGLVGPIKETFGVDDDFMGLLMGPAFVVLYVVAGVPIARFADRSSRVKIIAVGCIIWSLCTIATGLATAPWGIALARIGVGVGEAAFAAPAYSLLADYFKPEKRGIAFAILALATYIGQIAGQAGGPAIAHIYDWRTAFYLLGAGGVTAGFLLLLIVREPARQTNRAAQVPFAEMLAKLRRSPGYLLMMFAFGFGTLSGVAFGYWGPELFARSYGVPEVSAKGAFALYFGLSGMAGTLLFGTLMDRMTKKSMLWPVRMSGIALFAATACVLIATWSPSFTLAKAMAIPAGLMGGGWSIGFITTLQYMLPERFRAAATASFIMVTTLLGFFVGPWLAGAVSSALGNDANSLRIGLSVAIPFGLLGALLALFAVNRIEGDREKLAA